MSLFKKPACWLLIAALPALGAGCGNATSGLPDTREALLSHAVSIPGGAYEIGSREPGSYPVRNVSLAGFRIWPTEITKAWWNLYEGKAPGHSEDGNMPASELTFDDAEKFCAWISGKFGVRARLPTVAEWLVAAQAGTPGMPYPWGWGEPATRAVYDKTAAEPSGRHEPNALGLYDMAGNVAEWVRDDDPILKPVMGGSWAERDPAFLRINNEMRLPRMYKGKDVGFRIVIEP